jgi:hypothetical protein
MPHLVMIRRGDARIGAEPTPTHRISNRSWEPTPTASAL